MAAAANVSVQTVSNVTTARFDLMTPQTRARVEQAMRDLGYHPNVSAQGLRQARTRTLAFLVLDEAASFLADPLTAHMMAGVGDVARDADYGVLIRAERPLSERRRTLAQPLFEQRADAATVLMSGAPELRRTYVEQLVAAGVPLVVFDEQIADRSILSVRTAERESARQLTEHVLRRGHQRIAFIAARIPWPVVEQRHLGYRDAMEAAGVAVLPELELFEATWQAEGGHAMTEKLLRAAHPPTAIICGSDLLALGAISAARQLGLAVPDDVAVAGFDDFEFAAFVNPPLTTVRVAGYELGRIAARMLIDALDGRPVANPHVTLANEVIVRASA